MRGSPQILVFIFTSTTNGLDFTYQNNYNKGTKFSVV